MRKIFLITLFFSLFFALPIFAQTDTVWVRTHFGGEDTWASDIAVDKSGNVYVTGTFGRDYATVKYYPNGDTAWMRKYNGISSGWDYAKAIAVDDFGNVIVTGATGYTYMSGTTDDWATIKYDSLGNELWIRTYNGPGNDEDVAWALAVDDLGNVYVTGWSKGNGTFYDYATIKYDSSGNELWIRRYNRSNSWYEDRANSIVLDSSGNVYVTGLSRDSSTSFDYATIKYDSDGNELWIGLYNGGSVDYATGVTVDNSGYVYVTGWSLGSETGWDCATVKYDPSGTQLWATRYDKDSDWAHRIAIDDSGNTYITGTTGAYPDNDYLTIKYDSSGNEVWVRTYAGPASGWDEARDLAVDNSGNVYVTGFIQVTSSPESHDFATIKYDPSGNEICVKRYNSSGGSIETGYAIAVDDSGYVYVTGSNNVSSYTTIKYYPIIMVGDANSDGFITVTDLVYLINYLFRGGPAPNPLRSGNVNNDERLTVSDVVYLINYLFKCGPSPIC
jgi:hypothetical protein